MVRQLKSKAGAWVKPGAVSTKYTWAPGSYGGYEYKRPGPAPYPKTAAQARIGALGRRVGQECKTKRGSDFHACRMAIVGGRAA